MLVYDDRTHSTEVYCDCCGQRCDNYYDGQKIITFEYVGDKQICSECINDNINSL